jgi:uncharacterized membrane protein
MVAAWHLEGIQAGARSQDTYRKIGPDLMRLSSAQKHCGQRQRRDWAMIFHRLLTHHLVLTGWALAEHLLVRLVLLALIVSLFVLLVRAITRPVRRPVPTALGVLDDQFARGDITAEEYRSRRQTLRTTA